MTIPVINSVPPLISNDESNADITDPATFADADDITRPPASAELSTKWSSFQFELEGKLYTLPISYSELEADG